jgi:site-specific DNA-methyltransferase (adenine-specific)
LIEENKIIFGDSTEELSKIPDKSIDLVVIDPPYFMKLDHFKTRKRFQQTLSDICVVEHFFKDIFKEFERIIKPTGRLYCFCDGQSYPLFWFLLFQFMKNVRPIIWDKKTSINGYSWRHQHELIIFAEMPESIPIPTGDGDILRYSAVKVDARRHPAEKPVELLKALITKSSKEKDVILDCFAGCGSTMEACIKTNRNYIMIEIEQAYYELIKAKEIELLKQRCSNSITKVEERQD